ncbi:hypothetical protein [Deinococcus multiflagellatus]|uniref:hypothetical protein n=1 Tax=Deinococcus multiflagellatus TaxID=1656887 RepID=UPI001CCEE0B2|nr:hypothetical protein [Deinococcus multiflagellatus]MBZ9714931.1 hypothetical protein [Deinococcus multiflagellatus]
MPLPLAALLALPFQDRAPLDALVSEQAMRRALAEEGHQVATFGLWAVRRRTRRQDVLERVLRQPKDWTWIVLAPVPPGDLSAADADLLARTIQGLHGVRYVQWTATEQALTFTAWPLRTAVVRGAPILTPGASKPEGRLNLPPGPLLPDLSRWASVPEETLGAALIESAYIERVAAADPGAFTNVDVLALAGQTPVVIEVKRRARTDAQEADPLSMTTTQAGTLGHLKAAGCDVHVAVLVVPKGSTRQPEEALKRGTWRAGAPVIRPGWGEMHVDLLGTVEPLSLATLRQAQAEPVPSRPPSPSAPARVLPLQRPQPPLPRRPPPELQNPRPWFPGTWADTDLLSLWARTPVRLGGRVYPHAAGAFLAARTLDQTVRETLTGVTDRRDALTVARPSAERPDWLAVRDRVAAEVLRVAYRGDRGAALVATLPGLLVDAPVFSPLLDGLQGRAGLDQVLRLRGQLARAVADQARDGCGHCAFAGPAPWPGFVRCAHPKGAAEALRCVGELAVRGPGGTALVPVHAAGGRAFRPKP